MVHMLHSCAYIKHVVKSHVRVLQRLLHFKVGKNVVRELQGHASHRYDSLQVTAICSVLQMKQGSGLVVPLLIGLSKTLHFMVLGQVQMYLTCNSKQNGKYDQINPNVSRFHSNVPKTEPPVRSLWASSSRSSSSPSCASKSLLLASNSFETQDARAFFEIMCLPQESKVMCVCSSKFLEEMITERPNDPLRPSMWPILRPNRVAACGEANCRNCVVSNKIMGIKWGLDGKAFLF